MDHTLHFISGMPRSGSTLLCNILAQNPRFQTTHTSGCLDVLFAARNSWDRLIEHQAHPLPATKKRVLQSILRAYYADAERPVVFDKSRGWLAYLEMAEELLERPARVLVPVRPLPDILASMEKLHRRTSRLKQPPGEAEHYFALQTVEGRCQYWMSGDNLVGLAYNRVRDALRRLPRDRLLLIDFDDFTGHPQATLGRIYDFLGEKIYPHDLERIEQVTVEDDTLHGYDGLHQIRPRLEQAVTTAESVLGRELTLQYGNPYYPRI